MIRFEGKAAMLQILIVDDHPIFREGVTHILRSRFPGCCIHEAEDAAGAMEAFWSHPPDVVLTDISLPGRSGLDLLQEMHSARPGLPVIVITFYAEAQFAVRALKGGAAAYLHKSCNPEALERAVRHVLAGGRYVTPEVAELLAAQVNVDFAQAAHEKLSDREYDVFLRLGRGGSVGVIAQELNLSVKTISTYRSRIMAKTGFKRNAEIAQYAIRNHLVD